MISQLFYKTIIVACLIFSPLYAQETTKTIEKSNNFDANTPNPFNQFNFDCYDSSRGLPQNSANAFAETSDHYIFIATQNGFVKFDGITMDLFNKKTLNSLPTNKINDLVIDKNDILYIATDKGLFLYDSYGKVIDDFKKYNKFKELSLSSLALHPQDNTLYGTVTGKGVFSYSPEKGVTFFTPENKKLDTKKVTKIFVTKKGDIWLTTINGLYFFSEEQFHPIQPIREPLFSITENNDGSIFAGGKEKIYQITNNSVTRIYSAENGLPFNDDITALFVDSVGSLWIGTANSGIAKYQNNNFYLLSHLQNSRLKMIKSFYEDNENNIWIGSEIDGFCIAKRGQIVGTKLENHLVASINNDKSGTLWVNSLNVGAIKIKPDGEMTVITDKIGKNLRSILVDSSDKVWVSSTNSGLYVSQNHISFEPVSSIYTQNSNALFPTDTSVLFEDSSGNIWANDQSKSSTLFVFDKNNEIKVLKLPVENAQVIDIVEKNNETVIATKNNGLFKKRGDSDEITRVETIEKNLFIGNLYVDSKERLWIVTESDGVFVSFEGDIVKLSPEKGLPDELIYSIVEDNFGHFWFATNSGVFKISSEEIECFINSNCDKITSILYDERDGMPSRECVGGLKPSMIITKNNLLLVPTIKGIAAFNTKYSKTREIPEIKLTWMVVDNKANSKVSLKNLDTINLPSKTQSIDIFYSAPSFDKPNRVLFDYFWNKNLKVAKTQNRVATFNNLKSGSYTFTVRAYQAGSDTSKYSEKQLKIHIEPDIFETKKVKEIAIIFLVIFLSLFLFINKRSQVRREKKMQQIIDEKTYQLQLKNSGLGEAVMKDPLTELMNKRFLFEVEERKIEKFIESVNRRFNLSENRRSLALRDIVFAVIMMDIDNFKRINDIYGHISGDSVLMDIAQILRDSVRPDDILIRWGGEEFLIVLKNIPREKSIQVADTIRKSIEKHPFAAKDGTLIWTTASFGVSFLPFFSFAPNLINFAQSIAVADLALYHSKNNGKDMVTFVKTGTKIPANEEELKGMLNNVEYAKVNNFYCFEQFVPDNSEEFEI